MKMTCCRENTPSQIGWLTLEEFWPDGKTDRGLWTKGLQKQMIAWHLLQLAMKIS